MRRGNFLGWVLVGVMVVGPSACVPGRSVEPSPTVPVPSKTAAASAGRCDIALDDPCVAWRLDDVVSAGVENDLVVAAHADGRVAAYAADTGTMRWEMSFPAQMSVTAIRQGQVYLSSPNETVVLSAGDGTERWRRPVRLMDPADTSGIALVFTGAAIEGVDLDGETVWSAPMDSRFFFEGLGDSGRVVVPDGETSIAEYDRATGQPLWRYETAGAPIVSAVTSTLAAVRQTGDGGDGYVVIDGSGNLLAEHELSSAGGWLATVDDQVVELHSAGGVRGIDPETGSYAWELPGGLPAQSFGDRFSGGSRLPAALVVGADLDGVEVLAMIDPGTGQQRWQMRANLDLQAAVAGSTHVVLVRATGVTTWHDKQTGQLAATVIVRDPRILHDDPAVVLSGTTLLGLTLAD